MPICLHTDPGAASALGLVRPHEIPMSREYTGGTSQIWLPRTVFYPLQLSGAAGEPWKR